MDVSELFDDDGQYLYIDGCPCCNRTYNHPLTKTWEGGGIRTTYRCPRCGHTWFTSWQPQNGETDPADRLVRQRSAAEDLAWWEANQ